MKADVIKSMLSDPDCDPTEWFGSAMIQYAQLHPAKLLSDPICRRYILKGMEEAEQVTISQGMVALYLEEKDPEVVGELTQHLGNDGWRNSQVFQPWRKVFGKHNELPGNGLIAKTFTKVKGINCGLSAKMASHLNEKDAFEIAENWGTYSWDGSSWIEFQNLITSPEGLNKLMSNWLIEKLDQNKSDYSWPGSMQSILWKIFERLDSSHSKQWLDFLISIKLNRVWDNEYCKKLCKRQYNDGDEVNVNERLCRCGFSGSSNSGFSLHRKHCGESRPGLLIAARIKYAMTNPDSLICTGCGRKLKSKPGFTLHKKKCVPNPHYAKVRGENDNENEN